MPAARVEDLLREYAPQVLGALAHRHGQFDACEDAVQEALAAAVGQWPRQGIPDSPRAWLLTVATRSLVDHWRSDSARRRRESAVAAIEPVLGPYQVQAAIAALHDEAPTAEQTDWAQILALYEVLDTVAPGPLVTLSRAVALAHVHGPTAAVALVGTLDTDDRLAHTYRLEAVRGHLLEQAGNLGAASDAYEVAARATASRPEQLYLAMRAANLRHPPPITSS